MRDAARFLERKGYRCAEDEHGLSYERGGIRVSAYFPPMDAKSQLDIEFIKERALLPMRWVVFMATGRVISTGSGIDDVIEMLKYVKDNYSSVTDYSYCRKIAAKVSEYVNTNFIQRQGR